MTSGNLAYVEIGASQDQKEVTANADFAIFDKAITEQLSVDLSAGNHTLTTVEFTQNILFISTGNAVSRDLTVPQRKRSLFLIRNDGSATLNVIRGSTTITITSAEVALCSTDGTANGLTKLLGASGGFAVSPYSTLGGWFPGTFTNSEKVLSFEAAQAFRLPASGTGSEASSDVASTGSVDFTILKNGGSVGTITFAADDVGTFTVASAVDFAAGDVLDLIAPASADATLAYVRISLLLLRL